MSLSYGLTIIDLRVREDGKLICRAERFTITHRVVRDALKI